MKAALPRRAEILTPLLVQSTTEYCSWCSCESPGGVASQVESANCVHDFFGKEGTGHAVRSSYVVAHVGSLNCRLGVLFLVTYARMRKPSCGCLMKCLGCAFCLVEFFFLYLSPPTVSSSLKAPASLPGSF